MPGHMNRSMLAGRWKRVDSGNFGGGPVSAVFPAKSAFNELNAA